MLAPIIYIDLVGLSQEDAKRALLDGLKPSGKPAQPPVFPGTQAQAGISASPFPPNIARPHGAPAPDVLLPPPPHECRECLSEAIPAAQHLSQENERNRAASLSYWGFATGLRIGELEVALRIAQQEEALCLELGNKESLEAIYGNQALILQAWGRLEEAMALLKKVEALCLELGNRSHLAYCYWSWGLVAREQRDRNTEGEKLTVALDIFTELNMPRERDAVRAELEKTAAADRAT